MAYKRPKGWKAPRSKPKPTTKVSRPRPPSKRKPAPTTKISHPRKPAQSKLPKVSTDRGSRLKKTGL